MIEKSSEGRWVVIIVDEAQNLPDETLEELRLLSNLETDKDKLLQILLIGQTELESRLLKDKLRQLNQRIITRVQLRHFNSNETRDYISHRLIRAGKNILKIDKKACGLVYRFSKGVPRLINMLMSRALMAAYLEENNTISRRHIMHAVKSLGHSDLKIKGQRKLAPLAIAAALILIIAGGYVYYNGQEPRTKNQEPRTKTQEPRAQNIDEKHEPSAISHQPYITVKVGTANLREAPSVDSKKAGLLVSGDNFMVHGEALDDRGIKWYKILHGGRERWISGEVVEVRTQNAGARSQKPE